VTYQLDTFLVNLADPGGKRYLKLTMELELDNPKVIDEITKENFKIRDTILLILSSKEFDDISTVGGKLALKKEIMAKLNGMLHTGKVLNIYFTEFLVQ
ncbi:MAG: flagellar basal body-associated FliL family protein, partial [Deltaproteobacteria bacterium]|nr:flagellar basal body-associated FliL family protein [Deltaproteobacteria bacterium]